MEAPNYDTEQSIYNEIVGKNAENLKQFLTQFITRFLEKLAVYSMIVTGDLSSNPGKNFKSFQKIVFDIIRPAASLLGTEVSLPINIGLTLVAYTAMGIKKKIQKQKAKRILNTLRPNSNLTVLLISILACDTCRMYEHQINLLGKEASYGNIKILANTIVKRVLNFISSNAVSAQKETDDTENSSTNLEAMAKQWIYGVFDGISKTSSKDVTITINGKRQKFACGDLLTQLGVTLGDMKQTAKVYYFEDQYKDYIKFLGHRRSSLLLDPRNIRKTNSAYLPLSEYSEENSHCLKSDELKNFFYNSKITSLKDFIELKQYAKKILKLVFCDDPTYCIKESLKSLKDMTTELVSKDALHKEIEITLKQMEQKLPKAIEEAIQLFQTEFLSMDKLLSEMNERFKTIESATRQIHNTVTESLVLAQEHLSLTRSLHDLVATNETLSVAKNGWRTMRLQDMFNIPAYPVCIVRKEFIDKIEKALQCINEKDINIFVYGRGGSGKTVAVSQTVLQFLNSGGDKYDVVWIKIGDVDDIELFNILKKLANKLQLPTNVNSEWNLEDLCSALRVGLKAFIQNSSASLLKVIFVFDDVWDERYLRYFSFADNSIVTTRYNIQSIISVNQVAIAAPSEFTLDEAMQVIQTYQKDLSLEFIQNQKHVTQAIESCQRFPLAVALMGAQRIHTDEEWKNVINKIQGKNVILNQFGDYDFNLYETFQHSINKLTSRNRDLFKKLGAFKKVEIPLNMIAKVFHLSLDSTINVLQEFQERTLINKCDIRTTNTSASSLRYTIHDLLIDHLQIPPEEYGDKSKDRYLMELNEHLISSCCPQNDKSWCSFEDDGYFYQNIVDHAILANNFTVLESLCTSIEWLQNKLIACNSISEFKEDIRKCYEYLKNNDRNSRKLTELYGLLQKYSSYLPAHKSDFIQFVFSTVDEDNWIYKATLKLARKKMKQEDSFYAKVSYSENRRCEEWDRSIRISSDFLDTLPRCSNSLNETFKIISSANNDSSNSKINVIDYKSEVEVFSITKENMFISEVRISADGAIVAFSYCKIASDNLSLRNDIRWEVWSVNPKYKILFVKASRQVVKLDFFDLAFNCTNSHLLVTVTADRKQIQLWKVFKDKLLLSKSSIIHEYEINGCSFANNGLRLISWSKTSDHTFLPMRSDCSACEIKIWNVSNLLLPRSIVVLENIKVEKYESPSIDAAGSLRSVLEVNESMLLLDYSIALGLLLVDLYDSVSILNFREVYRNILKAVIYSVTVSYDGKYFAALTSHNEIIVFTTVDNLAVRYKTIQCTGPNIYATFVMNQAHILAYNCNRNSIQLYKIDTNQNTECFANNEDVTISNTFEEVLQVSAEFVAGVPTLIKLLKLKDQTLLLKVMKGNTLIPLSAINLGDFFEYRRYQYFYKCCLYSDLNSVIIVDHKKCLSESCTAKYKGIHWHCTTVNKNLDNVADTVWRNVQTFPECVHHCLSKYRRSDKKLIFVKLLRESRTYHLGILDSLTGDNLFNYQDPSVRIQYTFLLFHDQYNFVAYSQTKEDEHFVKIYHVGRFRISVKESNTTKIQQSVKSVCLVSIFHSEISMTDIEDIENRCHDEDLFDDDWKAIKVLYRNVNYSTLF
ncbi:Apoptotic protease-activating factor 1 [Trichoplax sp. H2]|nr:Apoptotic protease-activating factor 1 [Trichoplax sp. H2]|eukprot:RDD38720.1 Apoptotic protease-activating factor 1 [Trichoplax sp. H2]